MATTTNFGWTTPDDTDLVKDGAAAIRTLGSSIDTSLVDLKGGTTGQVLTKASNTDLDFSFTTPATNPLTTTGDIIYSSSGSTAARLGIGTAAQVLAVNSGATAPEWVTPSSGGMTQIATGSLNTLASVVISSIPGTYKDLVLVLRAVGNSTNDQHVRLRFNNDSGANRHDQQSLLSSQANVAFDETSAQLTADANNTSDVALAYAYFPDYTNTDTWKMFWCKSIAAASTATNYNFRTSVGLYNQTGAITSLGFFPQGGTFTSGNYILYGVA